MSDLEFGKHIVIAAFSIAALFVLGILFLFLYWGNKNRKSKNDAQIKEVNVEIGVDSSNPEENLKDTDSETNNKEQDDYDHMKKKAFSEGINLVAYSSKPESKAFKFLLAQSKQSGDIPSIGIFNQSRQIKEGTIFGPFDIQNDFFMIKLGKRQIGKKRSKKALKDFEISYSWLGFINSAPSDFINLNIIERNDGSYFYEACTDIAKGEELLALIGWSEDLNGDPIHDNSGN